MWCIPKITPQFRERMYDLLALYPEPYDPKRPKVAIDEKSKQLISDTRKPIPMKPGSPEKYDYEYARNGTVNIFVAVEHDAGKRYVKVTDRRTKKDFALYMKELIDEVYPDADLIRVIMDNLNTHNETSFYEAFNKKEAKRLLKKIEWHYTPKHASWLNVAEVEIGVMDTECIGRRIGNKETLVSELQAWEERRNKDKKKINWKFTRELADEKMSKYYVT